MNYRSLFRILSPSERRSLRLTLLVLILPLGACIRNLPAPNYPFKDPAQVRQEAQQISDRLNDYITRWSRGKASATIPAELIPSGIVDNKNFVLRRPGEVSASQIWLTRESAPIDLAAVHNGVPDPNVTYLLLATPFAPFGSRLVIEGQFPHARFFSFQLSAPLDGLGYTANRVFGGTEVSLVDTDIEPLPGSVNPFRAGADRDSRNRGYRVSFDLEMGNPVALNPSFRPPYRSHGNHRVGSLLVSQGPWGINSPFGIGGKGPWNVGVVWVRIYAPDRNCGPLGGVPLPQAWFELSDGTKYLVDSDTSKFRLDTNATMVARETAPQDPKPSYGAGVGWFKSFGILRSLLEGVAQANGWNTPQDRSNSRSIDLGVTGRGEFQPPPGNYEPHATSNNYNTYLGRTMALGRDRVIVLTGKLPTFPLTRDSQGTMTGGQARYWSLTGYDYSLLAKRPGSAIHSVMDDQIVTDRYRRYIIAYSRPEDRPVNATPANGVTWVNWGPTAELGLLLRWLTVSPEWSFALSPDERHLTWSSTDQLGSQYNPSLIGYNGHTGFLGEYLPEIHYLKKTTFEQLGGPLKSDMIPPWE